MYMEKLRERAEGKKQGAIRGFFRRFWTRLHDLFEPEEVEVTFKSEGNRISYTYTKVAHKQIA